MQYLSAGKFAVGILTLMTVGIATGLLNQDPLIVNEFLYDIGLWQYFN